MSRHRTVQKPFLRIFLSFLRSYYHNYGSVFSPWCFTHQYKNTTQFYFYAALLSSQNTKSLSTHYEHYKTDETKDNFIVSLPIGVHFFSVQNVHSEFAYDTGKNIWGFGTMLVFGIMSGYRAILYVTAHGELYIRHYVSNTPHVGWIKIK